MLEGCLKYFPHTPFSFEMEVNSLPSFERVTLGTLQMTWVCGIAGEGSVWSAQSPLDLSPEKKEVPFKNFKICFITASHGTNRPQN